MLDPKKLKAQGVRYARALQIAVRTAGMLSVEHAVATGPIQQSFDLLNAIVRETRDFTIGFANDRLMLNTILTAEKSVGQLESDFLKRGIGAVHFEAGLTLARYKQVIALLAAPLKAIEQHPGGMRAYLAEHPVEGVRIIPAGKNQKRTESGDTLIEMDPEAFLAAQHAAGGEAKLIGDPLAQLFESAGLPQPESAGSPSDIMRLVGPTLERALTDSGASPDKAYVALAQILQGVGPKFAMAAFPPARQPEVAALNPREAAGELIMDTALNWATRQLEAAPTGENAYIVEDSVVRVLARSLHATQMAEKLAARLAQHVREYTFPQQTYAKIQEELAWIGLLPEEKHRQLLATARYDQTTFRRLLEHVKELLSKANIAEATELARHYFDFLQLPPGDIRLEELSRAPELIRAMAGVRTGFMQATTEQLIEVLQQEGLDEFRHFQLVNALGTVASSSALYEDFDAVQIIGQALEESLATNPNRHAGCCEKILRRLLPENSLERIIELFVQKREELAWARAATVMIRRSGRSGIELLFQRIESETVAANRLALLRLIGRTGSAGIEVARQRLADKRWYVVRNACNLLAELRDPELVQQVTPVLQHEDVRVQQAAAGAIIKSREGRRAQVLSAALPFLKGDVLEQALSEIMFVKDPASLPDLEGFIFGDSPGRPAALVQAVQAVAANPAERSVEVLGRILAAPNVEVSARKIALGALARHPSEKARRLLAEFVNQANGDALAAEGRQALAAAH